MRTAKTTSLKLDKQQGYETNRHVNCPCSPFNVTHDINGERYYCHEDAQGCSALAIKDGDTVYKFGECYFAPLYEIKDDVMETGGWIDVTDFVMTRAAVEIDRAGTWGQVTIDLNLNEYDLEDRDGLLERIKARVDDCINNEVKYRLDKDREGRANG